MNPVAESINACKYLYLHELGEPAENELRLVIAEATVGGPPNTETLASEPMPEIRDLLASSQSIVHGPGCRVFEILWPSYIGYSVRNESYALPEPKHAGGTGRLLVEYTKSGYLDYLASCMFANADYPGPFKHWAVYCLNHVVDVASTEEPIITVSIRAQHGAAADRP